MFYVINWLISDIFFQIITHYLWMFFRLITWYPHQNHRQLRTLMLNYMLLTWNSSSKLTWKHHIAHAYIKIFKCVRILRIAQLTISALTNLYYLFACSILIISFYFNHISLALKICMMFHRNLSGSSQAHNSWQIQSRFVLLLGYWMRLMYMQIGIFFRGIGFN